MCKVDNPVFDLGDEGRKDILDHFFDRLAMVDKTKMKYQSMVWKLPKEPSPKKVKASRSAVKVTIRPFYADIGGLIVWVE